MVDDKEPFHIVVKEVVDNPDGGATYSFDIGDEARDNLANIGLEFVLYCAATGTDIQDAYNLILKHSTTGEDSSD